MTWWQNTHFKPITRTALCCHKISNWLILWRHLVTLIHCKAKTKSTLKRSFLGECSYFLVSSMKAWIFWRVWWKTCWNRDAIVSIKTYYMVCQTTKRLTPKHIGEERAGWFTVIALMMYWWLLVLCYLCLPRSAFVWLAMCDCGISWSYSLLLLLVQLYTKQTYWTTWCSCSMQKVTLLE